MPRDGSDVYTLPFPDVSEGTTIESAVYNGFTNDVAIDLNTPRPITSGGTGADNAVDAMAALGGEISKIEVTNYASHNFTPGSFYSKASATGGPVDGHAFAGICYVAVVGGVATSDMFIEVRDRDETTRPGSQYVRQKKAGTWSSWLKAVGTAAGTTPPAAPAPNALWWDPTRGKLFIYYVDADSSQWVEAVAVPDIDLARVEDVASDAGAAAGEAAAGDAIDSQVVRYDIVQALTAAEKEQARENISADIGAFLVDRNGVNQTGMTANAANKIIMTTERADANGWFDPVLSRYTPQVAGTYQFTLCLSGTNGTGVGAYPQPVFYKNGVTERSGMYQSSGPVSGANIVLLTSSIVMNGTTDYVEPWVYQPPGVTTVTGGTNGTNFSGFRIGD